jgi:hypothetical protein
VLGFVPGITVPTDVPGQGLLLGIFAVNAIHNIAHLVLGAAMVYGGMSDSAFWSVAKGLAAVFVVLVVGSVIAPVAEGIAINLPDTILHLVSALLVGYLAFATRPEPESFRPAA